VPEAPLEDPGSGLAPAGDGWFVMNVRDAQWMTPENSERKPPGSDCRFESRGRPADLLRGGQCVVFLGGGGLRPPEPQLRGERVSMTRGLMGETEFPP
jgi:hypothetical protein